MPVARDCPICLRDDAVLAGHMPARETRLPIVVCRGCGLVYVNPMFTDAEKQAFSPDIRRLHRSRSAQMTHGRALAHSRRRANRWDDYLQRWVAPGQQVLEIGSGDGAMLELLLAHGARPTGVDPDAATARSVGQRLGVPVVASSFESAAFDETFDAAVMLHLIEHLTEPVRALARVHGLLRPGGLLLLETPNILRPKVGPQRVFSLPHNYHFSPRTMLLALHKARFEPLSVRIFNRDAFQIVARAVPRCGAAPGVEPWRDVLATLRGHKLRYAVSLQFLWRKTPWLRERLIYGGTELTGEPLARWLRQYAPPLSHAA